MPEIRFNHLPTKDELSQALSQAMSTANPVDDLLELSGRLQRLLQHDKGQCHILERYWR